ncbi:ABC transporter permease [Galbitalea sp. SE-J8]|uniref:ABC transporter permease n=1 Tax=Galbitalea sp. SE-J8 TaxID=3054952 RepID=UPI00259CC51E|nr:ABC transporter permease [Galbitalea sp. SE-J8]MDM4762997.1 ABC transporter permease [Galbitalea sp. SE-J8]
MKSNKAIGIFGPIIGTVVIIFVLSPLVVVTAISFTGASFISFPWEHGWSLRWFTQLAQQTDFLTASINSVTLAAGSALLSIAIGVPAAVAFARHTFPGKSALLLYGSSPLFVPLLLTGLALLIVLSSLGQGPTPVALLFGFAVVNLPFVLRIAIATLVDFNVDQENAANNLGASALQAFVRVTLPQIGPGIVSAFLLAFIIAFDSVPLAVFFVTPDYDLLPVKLFFYAQTNFDPLAAAVSVAMIGFSIVLILVIEVTFGLEKVFGGGRSSAM